MNDIISDYFYYGLKYEFGVDGIEIDYKKAEYWFKKAYAHDGNIDAMISIARIRFNKTNDTKSAYSIYKNLEGKNNPTVFLYLGKIYDLGLVGEKDRNKAEYYYKNLFKLEILKASHITHV